MSGPRVLDRGTEESRADGFAAGTGPDPRFRERRIAVRKDAGRRRLKRLLIVVLAALVALAGVIVVRSPVLDVDEVTVVGTARLAPDDIRTAAGIDEGAPLLLADMGAAARDVEALPWVAEAEVTRDLPGRVRIDGWVSPLGERRVNVRMQGTDLRVLADASGRFVVDDLRGGFVQLVFHPLDGEDSSGLVVTPLFKL